MKLYSSCFRDQEAASAIRSLSKTSEVSPYDGREAFCVELEEFADALSEFFSIFEASEAGVSLASLLQEDWDLFNMELPKYEVFLASLLAELGCAFNVETKVAYISEIEECVGVWDKLKKTLVHERRFILKDGEYPGDSEWDNFLQPNRQLRSGEFLYRARVNEECPNTTYSPDEMSCPPAEKTPGGRANSAGIPVLYLCKDPVTAAYEVRSLHHDAITIGMFQVKEGETLNIVDFTKTPSVFNGLDFLQEAKRCLLMHRISKDLSKPMRRYSRKTEYVPTQYICEFIRYVIGADAIQFASSLKAGGINLVVFDSDKMECVGTQLYLVSDYQLGIRLI